MTATMQALVLKGPEDVVIEQRPLPELEDELSAIAKVRAVPPPEISDLLGRSNMQRCVAQICILTGRSRLPACVPYDDQQRPLPTAIRFRLGPVSFQPTLGLKAMACSEFCGTIESVGSKVKSFKKGDRVVSPFTMPVFAADLDKSDVVQLMRRLLLLQARRHFPLRAKPTLRVEQVARHAGRVRPDPTGRDNAIPCAPYVFLFLLGRADCKQPTCLRKP
jgi:hypothetical protein